MSVSYTSPNSAHFPLALAQFVVGKTMFPTAIITVILSQIPRFWPFQFVNELIALYYARFTSFMILIFTRSCTKIISVFTEKLRISENCKTSQKPEGDMRTQIHAIKLYFLFNGLRCKIKKPLQSDSIRLLHL